MNPPAVFQFEVFFKNFFSKGSHFEGIEVNLAITK